MSNAKNNEQQPRKFDVVWNDEHCSMQVFDLPRTAQPVLAYNPHGCKYMWCDEQLFMADGAGANMKWIPAVSIPGDVLVELMQRACSQRYGLSAAPGDGLGLWVGACVRAVKTRLEETEEASHVPGMKVNEDPLADLVGVWKLSDSSVLVCNRTGAPYIGTLRINGRYMEAPELGYPLDSMCGLLLWLVKRMEELK